MAPANVFTKRRKRYSRLADYTRDFEVELLYRDNRLNPIHEGTTGIQAIDLVARKIRKDRGQALRQLHARIQDTATQGLHNPELDQGAASLARVWLEIIAAGDVLIAEPSDGKAIAQATTFLSAFGHAVVGWLWLDQAIEATNQLAKPDRSIDASFLQGKLLTWRFFAETELPKVTAWLAPIMSGSDLLFTVAADTF
jgi:hypothetical protein